MNQHKLWIGGRWEDGQSKRDVLAPFDGRKVAECAQASPEQLERALAEAHRSFELYRSFSSYTKARLLAAMVAGIQAARAELVELIVHEAGKPRGFADGEVGRAIQTFTIASEEAKRMGGERLPIDLDAGARAYEPAVVRWVPRGPVLAIGPFNFPLNLLAHKVAPALASGCSVVVKPPPQAPGAAACLARIFEKAAREASDSRETVPLGLVQVLSGSNEVIGRAVTDPRIQTLSFTGSDKVGWMLQGQAIRKKVGLELGGNAAVIVHSDADLARAAARCAYGAYAYAGQICISVQRIFAHKSVFDAFKSLMLSEIARLKAGDPAAEGVSVGPMIDGANADRVLQWVDEAKREGARLLCGGGRRGNVIDPILLTGTRPEQRVNRDEIFGPVATLESYDELETALKAVNDSRFGLQAGIFADSSKVIARACDAIDAGGVIVNDVPTFRADNMPYGGAKDSGLGREGLCYAMEEFSERKVVIVWRG